MFFLSIDCCAAGSTARAYRFTQACPPYQDSMRLTYVSLRRTRRKPDLTVSAGLRYRSGKGGEMRGRELAWAKPPC